MKRFMWNSRALLTAGLRLGTASAGFAQATVDTSAVVTVTAGACTTPANGACKPNDANGGAGPNPANIEATISLCQVNGQLRGVGKGVRFEFGKTYVSLLYKNDDAATCSRAPRELTPLALTNVADPRVDSDFASMMLGVWIVAPDGTGTLIVNKQAPVTGLQNYRTVSVREMQVPDVLKYYRADLDPAPQFNALRACGSMTFGSACSPKDVCASLCIPKIEFCPVTVFDPVCAPVPPLEP